MKASIVPSDELVYVEGESHTVNMDDMPDYAHAVQWYGSYGEVEFKPDKYGKKLPNLRFTDFGPFEFMIDRWRQRKQTQDEKAKRELEEKAAIEAKIKDADEKSRQEKPL